MTNLSPVPMVRLSYVSRRPEDTSTDMVVNDIILPAMRKNRELDITGCLWFSEAHFFQVLEGPAAEVTKLFDEIKKDRRHDDVRLVDLSVLPRRTFERFAMKLIEGDTSDEVEGLIEQYGTSAAEAVRKAPSAPKALGQAPMWIERVLGVLMARPQRA